MDKNAIKKYAVWARNELIARVMQKAAQYGITEEALTTDDTSKKIERNADAVNGNVLTKEEKTQRIALIDKINDKGYEQVIEEVAYTWFNRFSALRFMEVNNYLPTHIRVFTDEENNFRPQILEEAIHLELDGLDMEKVYAYKEANDNDGLYKYLLITQCNALNKILPGMFQKISDYTELLFPDNLLREGSVIEQMIALIPEDNFDVNNENGQVEIIGWLYQYYNDEKKNEVINIYKGNVKKEDIPAATQLFTTDWVVRYIIDNSVGRYWIERNPQSNLKDELQYFVTPKDDEIKYIDEKITPQDLTVLDPCMGSAHFLVYAFDVLVKIYAEYGYSERDAASEIVKHNIYGLDIDDRATQLAYFAVMMKARQYDRRFLTRGIEPHIHAMQESKNINSLTLNEFVGDDKELEADLTKLLKQFENAKELGTIIRVEPVDFERMFSRIQECNKANSFFTEDINATITPIVKVAYIMSQKYAVVATNPPYLNKMDAMLKDFVNKNYKDYSADLFSVFMYRNFGFCKKNGYSGFMTPFVWMFIKNYEKLRTFILENKSIVSLIQMEYSAFEEATVPICSFVLENGKDENKSLCFRLSDFKGGMEVQKQKVLEALTNKNCGYFYEANEENFSKIPGSPIAYWVTQAFINAIEISKPLGTQAYSFQGIITGDNNYFLRLWHEITGNRMKTDIKNYECSNYDNIWVPYNKGGGYRRWYGNNEYLLRWVNQGKTLTRARTENSNYYFKEGVTWSFITSGTFSCRYFHEGALWDVAGSSIFATKNTSIEYICALMNSKVAQLFFNITNPTINYQVMNIIALPYLYDSKNTIIEQLAKDSIKLSKQDWDSFETSWDFAKHPIVRLAESLWDATAIGASMQHYYGGHPKVSCPIELCFMLWQGECNERFNQLKANEEELNRIFIDIYGLQDELTPDVEDKDVTVRKADLQRDIKSLISYAVGCMFGRYSLDVDGLAYAGGEYDESKYSSYPADADNIIPICDDEYFGDDIVGRFEKFVEVVYGKETLEENLSFIANALGGTGTPREVIRKYFLNDFYADHLKIYQKRPIYWLFDSGKKNGFKALIYMHRYKEDTLARMRTDYVHEQQARYRTAMEDLEQRKSNCAASERVRLTKQLSKIKDQDIELRAYEEKIHHLADKMIRIDLDDGVKHNYNIFKDVLAKIK